MKNNNKQTKNNVSAKRLAKIERYINTHRGEVKYTQGTLSITPLVAGSQSYNSGVGQGDTSDTRTGLRINAHKFYLNIAYKMTSSCNVRCVVVRDMMNQGAVPTITEVLEQATVISPLNYNNFVAQKRFILMKDFTRHFTVGGVLFDTVTNSFKLDVQLSYGGSGFGAIDARKNSIFVYTVTDTASAGTIDLYSRLDFTDE